MPRQFVILRHEMPAESQRPSHWDLMLPGDGVLHTWAIDSVPRAGSVVSAQRLPDHRIAYLDYEGPVSRNRGRVTRWDRGECRIERSDEAIWIAQLTGVKLQCRVVLERVQFNEPATAGPLAVDSFADRSAGQANADHAQRWTCRFEVGDGAEA